MFGSHSEGSLKTHLWHLSDATFPINLFTPIYPIKHTFLSLKYSNNLKKFQNTRETERESPREIYLHILSIKTPTHYPPFSIIIQLNGHFAEGLSDRILSINIFETICSSPTAKPIFPHQHPAHK